VDRAGVNCRSKARLVLQGHHCGALSHQPQCQKQVLVVQRDEQLRNARRGKGGNGAVVAMAERPVGLWRLRAVNTNAGCSHGSIKQIPAHQSTRRTDRSYTPDNLDWRGRGLNT